MNEKAKILVVDDEEGMRNGCRIILEGEGHSIETAEDGNEGYQKFKENVYDLVLIDIMMPGMGGMELLKRIHKRDENVICIVITGYATIENAVEAMRKGAYDYVPKPFTPDELMVVVNRGLEKRKLRLETIKLRKEREKNLLEVANEKSKLKTILSCMAEGILVINYEKQLVLHNSAAVRMLRLKVLSEVIQKYDDVITNKELLDLIQTSFKKSKYGSEVITREIEVDNGKKILLVSLTGVVDETGENLGMVLVLRDITKLKEVEKIKSQFVRMVAHELRTPLAAIEGYLDVYLTGSAGDDRETVKRMMQRSKERAHALLEMVNDLLELSSIDAGKIAQNKEPLNVCTVIEKSCEIVKSKADEKNITFKFDFPEKIPKILADRNDIERVFINLLDNAYKYNNETGTVTVSVRSDYGYIKISVTDTGIGIPAEEKDKIFEEFYRVKNKDTRYITGTGLGLSIVKRIVDSHFGYCEVVSEEGKGASFCVFLPIYKELKK